jgi:hypothetical protein
MENPAQIPAGSPLPENFINRGGTVRPVYGERRPIMYHLFKTEMDSISAFNSEALRWFSIGSLCLNCVIAIVIGYAFGTGPLSEFGALVLHYAAPFLGVVTAASFGFGIWAIYAKKGLIEQIETETKTEDKTQVLENSN